MLYVPPQIITTTVTTTLTKTTPAITNFSGKLSPSPTAGTKEGNVTQTAKVKEVKDTEEKTGTSWIWVIVIIVVLVVIGIGFTIWFCISKKQQKNRKKQAEEYIGNVKQRSSEDKYVLELFDKMDEYDAFMYKKVLFKLYLPELKKKGLATVGKFEDWRDKNGFSKKEDENPKRFNWRIEEEIECREEKG
ncbi:unnamed protein product [Meloidogyne enterolobii]|uniref:Uncharacterized protein n=1 Tax=Meloidogyne enterolobii TaxID=390850 RepID=A0ACB1A1I9_MELEN